MRQQAGSRKKRRTPRLESAPVIRESATALFLEHGYAGTSMDEIAARARISKQTIYTHFPTKEALFRDLVLANAARVDVFVSTIERATVDEHFEDALRRLARRYAGTVLRADVLRLRRLVIAEAGRFPDLARAYYERVPGRVYAALAELFARANAARALVIADPRGAAEHFAWLVLGPALDRAMFLAPARVNPRVLDRAAADAVRVFVSAYGHERRRG